MRALKRIIRGLVPRPLLFGYHYVLNWVSMALAGFPTRSLITIGVTGTNGKTSVVSYISDLLESAGFRTGYVSTATIKVGSVKRLNQLKMTMPGRWTLARMLRYIKKSGARYAIIETSSQGLEMGRHLGISYDIAVFTNLTPEHVEAHGSFENYRAAKEKLFKALSKGKRKKDVKKIIVANIDDANARYFLQYDADQKWGYSLGVDQAALPGMVVRPVEYACGPKGISFTLKDQQGQTAHIQSSLIGIFNLNNMLAAATVAMSQGISLDKIKVALEKLEGVPGRMEPIDEGQDYSVIVDYAVVPESLELVYKTLREQLGPNKKLIAVLGSAGGGRDVAKRPKLGALAARYAYRAAVTNEDPYDEEPMNIIKQVARGLEQAGKIKGRDYVTLLNRKTAIAWALKQAGSGDIVVITGKGCEPVIIAANGKRIPHDDRTVAREFLQEQLQRARLKANQEPVQQQS
ncbi:MAG: UDP-N-acetylmuramoyl-L-alanyl-D-glutamate--2,6-diaminopimelate ligase [bacterium]|nr:UDP-N-acetylmuramoyl-L-alanyl-D-glutamate--2,6-diaminopimelate ligase [bacterium]